jgi:hypothetical protein
MSASLGARLNSVSASFASSRKEMKMTPGVSTATSWIIVAFAVPWAGEAPGAAGGSTAVATTWKSTG